MVLAEDGKKMSKSLKNYPDPTYLLDEYGADALRLYLSNSPLVKGEDLRFTERKVKETVKDVLLPFWNAYSFFTTYANIDDYQPSKDLTASTNPLDCWIISRFQTLVKNIEREMEVYHVYNVVPALLEFLEDLTNWYVRRSRRRFWGEDQKDKQAGYDTLFYILNEFSKALAPFLPFMTEEIHLNLQTLISDQTSSVHLTDYPKAISNLECSETEEEMALIKETVRLGRILRARVDIRTRQPLQSITVVTKNEANADVLSRYSQHIQEELNVKEVLFSANESELVDIEVKPDFPTLGPVFGKEMKALTAALKELSDEQACAIEAGEDLEMLGKTIPASAINLVRKPKSKDLEIETSCGVTVFFDTNLTEDLIAEGLAREFVNRVQRMRKEAGFEISDRILTAYNSDDSLAQAINSNSEFIKSETLSIDLQKDTKLNGQYDYKQEAEIDGFKLEIALKRQ